VTPNRSLLSPAAVPPGLGVGTTDQTLPFQCRATVRAGVGSSTVPLLAVPAAQQLPADVQATDSRTVSFPPGCGMAELAAEPAAGSTADCCAAAPVRRPSVPVG
jgi:hypothetical protein